MPASPRRHSRATPVPSLSRAIGRRKRRRRVSRLSSFIRVSAAARPIVGRQAAFYIEDEWRTTDHFAILGGLRGDVLHVGDPPPYNRAVDSIFGRRTDALPLARVHLSPRVGFRWDVGRGQRDQ